MEHFRIHQPVVAAVGYAPVPVHAVEALADVAVAGRRGFAVGGHLDPGPGQPQAVDQGGVVHRVAGDGLALLEEGGQHRQVGLVAAGEDQGPLAEALLERLFQGVVCAPVAGDEAAGAHAVAGPLQLPGQT